MAHDANINNNNANKKSQNSKEVLKILNEMVVIQKSTISIIQENNELLKKLVNIVESDHKTNLDINDNVRKIKFNTQ